MDFAVLGDLGEGRFIVRMFVHNASVDEEFEAENTEDLINQINVRMAGIDAKEAKSLDTGAPLPDGGVVDQAFPLTPELGAI